MNLSRGSGGGKTLEKSSFADYSHLMRFGTGMVVVLIVGFVAFLLYSNYRGSTALRKAYLDRLKVEAAHEIEDMDEFFQTRKRELRNDLADSSEVTGFFHNKALGMSMDYGLNLSIVGVKKLFDKSCKTFVQSNSPIYLGMVLRDTANSNHVQFGTLSEADLQAISTNTMRLEPSVILSSMRNGFICTAPVYINGIYEGDVAAHINLEALLSRLGDNSPDLFLALLPAGEQQKGLPLFNVAETGIPYEQLAKERDHNGLMKLVPVTLKGKTKYYAILGRKLDQANFECVCFIDITAQFRALEPWRSLLSMTALSVVILGGSIVMMRLDTRARLLHARLEESLSHQKEVQDKNTQMSLEIAERKRVEEALLKSEQNYREIFNATKEAIFIHEAETGEILDANQATLDMYGFDRNELARLNPSEMSSQKHPYTYAEVQKRVREAFEKGPQLFEWHARRKNRELFWVEVALKKSEILGQSRVIAVVRDITERKLAQEEKERLETQLRQSQKLEAVGRLAGGVAHDFNNLLQVIQGNHDLAVTALSQDHPAYESLVEIGVSADRAAALVKQLLTFSRRAPFHPQSIDLVEVTTSIGKMLRRLIGEHIELEIKTDSVPQYVHGDRTQLEQVFVNLCVNARDAIEHKGKITIATSIVKNCLLGRQCASPSPSMGFVCVIVKDTGSGIPRELQDRIYEPFFTTKEVGKGTGLGLSTVYSIVERHNGHIHLESETGKGTAFYVYLPQTTASKQEVTMPQKPAPIIRFDQTLLLAEDEPSVRALAVRVLSQAGFHILEASDGEEALRLFELHASEIDFVVLDVVMPNKGGAEVYRSIHNSRPDLPVLFTSGYTFDNFADNLLPSEASFLSKPYHPSVLLGKINEIMESKKAARHG